MRLVSPFQLVCFCMGLFLVGCDAFASNEVYALTSFKEAIYEDPLLVLSIWNALDVNPCNWSGISCSFGRNLVTKLNISGSSLKGIIAPELGLLSFLQELILSGNGLIGIIPKQIGMLKNLKVLDLGANQLSGSIPPEIGNLASIVKINLQSNWLIGKLPPEFGKLKHLKELHLDRNKIQGTIPGSNSSGVKSNMHQMYGSSGKSTGFCYSSRLKVADFSENYFVGSIPKCLEYLPRSSFQGNCFKNTDVKQRPGAQCGGTPPARSHSSVSPKHKYAEDGFKHWAASNPTWLLALEIVTGTMVGSVFLVALLTALQKCTSKSSIIPWKKSASEKDRMTIYIDSEILKDIVRFNREELEVACEDFSNIIDSSPESLVYKGTMKNGPEIAVVSLCIREEHWTGFLELNFQKEVADLARLNHENIGKLLGYCRENTPFSRMLVFEYASNGTLSEHLHYGEGSQLSWMRRMKIIMGIAHGLQYLHTELEPPFIVSELNSGTVFLTEDFWPKLVDFESWRTILSRPENKLSSVRNEGSIHVLPNAVQKHNMDVQGNIYAFGVLLLEIISGRPPYCDDKGNLVDWAKDFLEVPEVMSYIVDPELKHFRYEDLAVICDVVTLCIQSNPSNRASMKELCAMLQSRVDTSVSAELRSSSLAWAELALSS